MPGLNFNITANNSDFKRKLQEEYEGNVKKQRHGAKDRSDAISFISYREMWQIAKSQPE